MAVRVSGYVTLTREPLPLYPHGLSRGPSFSPLDVGSRPPCRKAGWKSGISHMSPRPRAISVQSVLVRFSRRRGVEFMPRVPHVTLVVAAYYAAHGPGLTNSTPSLNTGAAAARMFSKESTSFPLRSYLAPA